MVRPDIDPTPIRARLAETGRVQIPDFLVPDAAERLHRCLHSEVPWTLALCDEAGMRTLPREQFAAMDETSRRALYAQVAAGGGDGSYRFAYASYMMARAYVEGRDPDLLLHRMLEFLNSARYLQFMRALTGEARIQRIDAQATRYRPGQFLRTHNDEHSGEQRLFAYVLNLTRRWQADWGGLLHFVDAEDRVFDTFMPRWNSLTIFRVPVRHTVSIVADWAGEDRYAITGWMLASRTAREAIQTTQRLRAGAGAADVAGSAVAPGHAPAGLVSH